MTFIRKFVLMSNLKFRFENMFDEKLSENMQNAIKMISESKDEGLHSFPKPFLLNPESQPKFPISLNENSLIFPKPLGTNPLLNNHTENSKFGEFMIRNRVFKKSCSKRR